MSIDCRPFLLYVSYLLVPARAFLRHNPYDEDNRSRYLQSMAYSNFALWGSGVACSMAYLAFKLTAEKTLPNTIAKFGIRFYASAMVLTVVISFAKFCQLQLNQR